MAYLDSQNSFNKRENLIGKKNWKQLLLDAINYLNQVISTNNELEQSLSNKYINVHSLLQQLQDSQKQIIKNKEEIIEIINQLEEINDLQTICWKKSKPKIQKLKDTLQKEIVKFNQLQKEILAKKQQESIAPKQSQQKQQKYNNYDPYREQRKSRIDDDEDEEEELNQELQNDQEFKYQEIEIEKEILEERGEQLKEVEGLIKINIFTLLAQQVLLEKSKIQCIKQQQMLMNRALTQVKRQFNIISVDAVCNHIEKSKKDVSEGYKDISKANEYSSKASKKKLNQIKLIIYNIQRIFLVICIIIMVGIVATLVTLGVLKKF